MRSLGKGLWKVVEIIARFVLEIICKILHKELSEQVYESFMQFVKFGLVGVTNTVISYLLYTGSLLLFRQLEWFGRWDYLSAQVLAFILSVLWSFVWNNKLVFTVNEGEQRNLWKALLKTYVSYSFTGLFLNSVLLVLWVKVVGISEFIAPIINLVVSVPVNFLINKFWAFKKVK